MIVEAHPFPDPDLGLRSGFPSVQVDAFILQGPPQAFDEDVDPLPGSRFAETMRGEEPALEVGKQADRMEAGLNKHGQAMFSSALADRASYSRVDVDAPLIAPEATGE